MVVLIFAHPVPVVSSLPYDPGDPLLHQGCILHSKPQGGDDLPDFLCVPVRVKTLDPGKDFNESFNRELTTGALSDQPGHVLLVLPEEERIDPLIVLLEGLQLLVQVECPLPLIIQHGDQAGQVNLYRRLPIHI